MGMPLDKRALDWGTTGNKINSRHIPTNFTPTNYTPTEVASEGTDKDSAHFKGIDLALASAGGVKIFSSDLAFNGTDLVKNVDVSSTVTDARKAQVQLLDITNDYERIFCNIRATSISNIRITTGLPLPSGNYRLLVFQNNT
jgi:hypothetical protein